MTIPALKVKTKKQYINPKKAVRKIILAYNVQESYAKEKAFKLKYKVFRLNEKFKK